MCQAGPWVIAPGPISEQAIRGRWGRAGCRATAARLALEEYGIYVGGAALALVPLARLVCMRARCVCVRVCVRAHARVRAPNQ